MNIIEVTVYGTRVKVIVNMSYVQKIEKDGKNTQILFSDGSTMFTEESYKLVKSLIQNIT